MSGAILLTGATGFLGMETLARLIDRGERQIVVIVRAEDQDAAQARLTKVWAQLYEEPPPTAGDVRIVCGDLLQPRLGLSETDRESLLDSVERIVHCAASISFDMSLEAARQINVNGLQRMIDLGREIASRGALRRIVHVSTAFVGGCHVGPFGEDDLDRGQEFRNTYERSKCEGELLLLRAAHDLPVVIARPSIVVGHSASGWTPAFNVIYWLIRAFERGLLEEVPARRDSIVDFVPVDYVTEGMLALLDAPDAHGTYSLVAGAQALCAGELVELYCTQLGRAPVRFVGQDTTDGVPRGGEAYVPYFDVRCSFTDARASELLQRSGVIKPDPRDYLDRLMKYAHQTRWGKRPVSRQASMTNAGIA